MADIKIILCSDNHRNTSSLDYIREKEADADYFFHCGDSMLPKQIMHDFISVEGNNDPYQEYPLEKIIEIGKYRFLLIHGHRHLFLGSLKALITKAKQVDCNVVCFGHTHLYCDECIEDIYLLNPGSTFNNRDRSTPGYMRITILESGELKREHCYIDNA